MDREKPTLCKSWKEVLSKMMTKEQLMTTWHYRDGYSPEYIALLKDVICQQYGISEEELNAMPSSEQYMKMQTGARDLFLDALKKMGCSYEILGEDGDYDWDGSNGEKGDIEFSIQQHNFCASAYNDWDYVILWKWGCYHQEIVNEEDQRRIIEVVNKLNDRTLASFHYRVEEWRRKFISVETKIVFPFIPTIPKLDLYLHRQIKFLFEAERSFNFELEKMRSEGDGKENCETARSARLEKINRKLLTMKPKEEKEPGSRDLFLKTLKRWKCPYEIDEYGDICFEYCGNAFSVEASNSGKFITIYDYGWNGASLDDIDELSRFRRAINNTNWDNCVNVVFTINEKANQIVVHSKMTILLVKSITGVSSYLKDVLNAFFRAHFLFDQELEKLKE